MQYMLKRRFENDVKGYGFQTDKYSVPPGIQFENDVKGYGFQTTVKSPVS